MLDASLSSSLPQLEGPAMVAESPDFDPVASAQAVGLTPRVLRARFGSEFVLRPAIYWLDLLSSAALGWSAFVIAGVGSGPLSWLALGVATLALYRAVLFIHELSHLRRGTVPGFETVWNLIVGLPLVAPSLMYWSHRDHHKRSLYGTERDPEYEPIAHWSPLRIALSILTMVIFPGLLVLRWSVIGPVSWLVPPLRRLAVGRLSTLVINPRYERQEPRGRLARRWTLQELGAGVYTWIYLGALASGAVSWDWAVRWYAVTAGILVLNHLRTLGAHRYENLGGQLDVVGQLRDSINLRGLPGITVLLAPVGLRYHGLHHLLPTLPYHSLGTVHRRLLADLPTSSPYRDTEVRGLRTALRSLLERAATNTRKRQAGIPETRADSRVSEAPAAGARETGPATPKETGARAAGR
jgi:fatty acid desaturase